MNDINLLRKLATDHKLLSEQDCSKMQILLNEWIAKLQSKKQLESELYNMPVEVWMYLLHKNKLEKEQKKLFKQYVRFLDQEMKLSLDADELLCKKNEIRLILLPERRTMHLPSNMQDKFRHIVIHGKVANISIRKPEVQEREGDLIKLSEIHKAIDRICMLEYYQERLKLPKYPKGLTLSDYLLQRPLTTVEENVSIIQSNQTQTQSPTALSPNNNPSAEGVHVKPVDVDIASVTNLAFNHIYVISAPAIIMSVPFDHPKLQISNFLRNSELRVYLDDIKLLQQFVRKNVFYHNYELKGINFVEEGEVDCKGRNIARGWVISGRAKTAGYAWQFPPIFFFKYIATNPSVWKQFVHVMDLNGEIPFQIDKLLQQTLGFTQMSPKNKQTTLLSLMSDKRNIRLPEIRAMSNQKIQQFGKLKHWDERLAEVSDFKQQVLKQRTKDFPKFLLLVNTQNNSANKVNFIRNKNRHMKQKSINTRRSISVVESKNDSNKSIEFSNKHRESNQLTMRQQNNRYQRQPSDLPQANDLQRRQSVLITSVLQRLSSLAQLPQDQQPPISRHQFMNARMVHLPKELEQFKRYRHGRLQSTSRRM